MMGRYICSSLECDAVLPSVNLGATDAAPMGKSLAARPCVQQLEEFGWNAPEGDKIWLHSDPRPLRPVRSRLPPARLNDGGATDNRGAT
jgi:hypothetical protein